MSGGRILSQTLDESMWCIDAILAYDLVSDVFTSEESTIVEWNLFRPMVIIS